MRETRKASGLTQQALADKLGKHQSFIAKYERGERRLDVVEFIRITEAMGVDPAVLVSRLVERRQ